VEPISDHPPYAYCEAAFKEEVVGGFVVASA
jgi:hypothetical protein